MKLTIKVTFIFVLFIMVVSCATTPRSLPEKYNFDNNLEAVDHISSVRRASGEQADNQSIILRVNWNDYYLLVLRRPIDFTAMTLSIINGASRDKAVSANQKIGPKKDGKTGSEGYFTTAPQNMAGISSGSDMIVAHDSNDSQSFYVIEKIYKLKGKEQAEEIKEWLRKYQVIHASKEGDILK
jgi:hypothetical protein